MSIFWQMVVIQLQGLFRRTTAINQKKGKGGTRGVWMMLLPLLIFGYISVQYTVIFLDIFPPESTYLVPVIISMMGVVLVFFFSVTGAQGQLFQFKDFDFLMSLPISKTLVMGAKLVSYLLLEGCYFIFLAIPAFIYYGINQPVSGLYWVLSIVGSFFQAGIPLILSALLALLIRKAFSKSRFQNLLTNLSTIVFVLLIMAFSFSLSYMGQSQAQGATMSTEMVLDLIGNFSKLAPTAYWFGLGATQENLGLWALSIGVNILALGAFVVIFQRIFIQTNTELSTGYHVKNWKLTKIQTNSQFTAILKKEMKKYFSNFMLVFNTIFGEILLLVGAVASLIYRAQITAFLPLLGLNLSSIKEVITLAIVACITFVAGMDCSSCSSISLEGRQLWLTKSLPIKTSHLFMAKGLVNVLIIVVPSILAEVMLTIGFGLSLSQLFLQLVTTLVVALFVAMLGLAVNLRFPKLNYDREIEVIKNSASSFVCIFGSLIFNLGLFFALAKFGFVLDQPLAGALVILGLYTVLDGILFLVLKGWGVKTFNSLSN